MRRMRRFFAAICVLVLFVAGAVPSGTAETLDVRDTAQKRDPYRPVMVESYTWGDFDVIHIMRTYQLSPVDDPAGIPTQDFEDHGWVYHMVKMTSEEEMGTDTRQITRTVTKSSDTDDTKKILRSLDATMEVVTDDGYSGLLRLDHTSVSVEAAEYATRNSAVSATRLYPDLADADLALIPKTIEDGGRTLTLDDVQWEEGWQTDAEGGFIRYSATASYVGTVSSQYATGYMVTANYTGEVSRSDVEMITWYVDYAPIREAEPVETPPQPTISAEESTDSVESDAGEEAGVTENPAAEDPAWEDSGTEAPVSASDSAGNPGETVKPVQKPERTRSTLDYSGLKRTLLSCGLLIALAAAAYLIHKYKRQRGGRNNS